MATPPSTPASGTSDRLRDQLQGALAGTYVLDRELGGGMARVYLAEETALGRRVVIKLLGPDLADTVSATRFEREVRLAANLQHPNVVPLLTAGEAGGVPYYVMPYVPGRSLRSRLDAGPVPPAEAVGILRDVARALAHAHGRGVVHRDVKPENVLLSDGVAVVTDFGIAKALSASRTDVSVRDAPPTRSSTLTSIGTSLGTPAYMAPEQVAGESVDHRADLYSWGVVAYELLAGAHPFAGRVGAQQIMAAHLAERPAPLAERAPGVPPHVAALVTRCLEKDPARRPDTAAALVDALGMVGAPAAGTPASGAHRRAPWVAAVLGAAAVAGAAGWHARRPLARAPARVVVVAPTLVSDAALAALAELPAAEAVAVRDARPDDWPAAARSARAALALVGDVRPRGDSVEIAFRVIDATRGEVLRAIPPARGRRGDEASLTRAAIDPALSAIGFVLTPQLGPAALPRGTPPRHAAFREVAAALALWYRSDTTSVRVVIERLQRATELDTSFFQARLWLALARSGPDRRYIPGAGEYIEAVRAEALARRDVLTPYETAFADFLRAASGGNGSGGLGVDALRRIEAMAPGSPVVRQLPQILADQNRPREAVAAEERVWRALRPPSDDSSLLERQHLLFVAQLRHYLGEYAAAVRATQQALELSAGDLVVLREQAASQAALGDVAGLRATLDRVSAASTNDDFAGFAGDVYTVAGQELIAHGRAALGDSVTRLAAAWYDTRTPTELTLEVAFRGALAYLSVGRLDTAMALLVPLRRERPGDARLLGAIGRVHARRGDTARARAVLDTLAQMRGARRGGAPTYERAAIESILGRRDEAVRLLRESLAQGVGFGFRRRFHWFQDLRPLRGYLPFEALITPAG